MQLQNIDFICAIIKTIGERWKSESAERAWILDVQNAGTEQIIIHTYIFCILFYIQWSIVYVTTKANNIKLKLKPNYKWIIRPFVSSAVLQLFKCLACTHPTKIYIYINGIIFVCLMFDLDCYAVHLLEPHFEQREMLFFDFVRNQRNHPKTQTIIHEQYNDIGPFFWCTTLHLCIHLLRCYFWLRSMTNADIFFCYINMQTIQRFRVGLNEYKFGSRYTRCCILLIVRLIQI